MVALELRLNSILDHVIGIEGGDKLTNDPKDSGGVTKWGITEKEARAFGYIGAMADMTREQAKTILRQRFWFAPRWDKVALESQVIAEELFDTGVNMGVVTAGKFLQRALNVLNANGTLYSDIDVDGMVGAMTIACLREYIADRGQEGVNVLLRMLNGQQSVRYIELAEARPKDERFEYGWQLNRVRM